MLGALPREILRLVVAHGVRLASIGVLVGVTASLPLRTVLQNQLFGVSPTDPFIILAVSGLLVLVAIAASTVPAVRAARTDPVVALRQN